MTSIYDDKKEFESVKGLTIKLREFYETELKMHTGSGARNEQIRVRSTLAIQLPGDERVQQLLRDTFNMLLNNNVDVEDVK